ncbi:unnamed protein product [Caenorhabditis brenneri]
MFTIKKRTSCIEPPSPRSILRKGKPEISTPRKVGFFDDVGKPLVEYRAIPPREIDETLNHMHPHEKAAGQLILHKSANQINRMPWTVYRVKNAPTPKECCSEVKMQEEARLEKEGACKFPLIGTFDAFDPPGLKKDAEDRAMLSTPVDIPLGVPVYTAPEPVVPVYTAPEPVFHPQPIFKPVELPQNTYQQVFETPPEQIAAQNAAEIHVVSAAVNNLMAQLKERGLVPVDKPEPPPMDPPPYQEPPPPRQRPSRWTQASFKVAKTCVYFINRPNGCTRGDTCRYQHDEAERERRQLELQQSQAMREESWRRPNLRQHPYQQRGMPYNHPQDRRRVQRSRSP